MNKKHTLNKFMPVILGIVVCVLAGCFLLYSLSPALAPLITSQAEMSMQAAQVQVDEEANTTFLQALETIEDETAQAVLVSQYEGNETCIEQMEILANSNQAIAQSADMASVQMEAFNSLAQCGWPMGLLGLVVSMVAVWLLVVKSGASRNVDADIDLSKIVH